VAIVTGGGRGIGEATARTLACDGVAVAVVARTAVEVEGVAAGIREGGGQALALAADVSQTDSATAIAGATEAHFGRPCDILVNAAGITGPVVELAGLDMDSFRHAAEVNLLGALALSQAVLPSMQRNAWGRIVNVTSGLARRAQPGLGAYSTTKAALLHLSRIMDAEGRPHGVRVFALEPGVVRSSMNESLRSLEEVGVGAGVVQMLRDIERSPGFVDATESASLIRLAATGQADDLAGEAASIYDPDVRARIAA
jgi:NAD(P)-dependent dehydrogenase (short-subunit alcohol dehydrogenase family)